MPRHNKAHRRRKIERPEKINLANEFAIDEKNAAVISQVGASPYDPRIYTPKSQPRSQPSLDLAKSLINPGAHRDTSIDNWRVLGARTKASIPVAPHVGLLDSTIRGYGENNRHVDWKVEEKDDPMIVHAIQEQLQHPEKYPMPSAECFRNTLSEGVMAINPQIDVTSQVASALGTLLRYAVQQGRMIDFGMVPNDTIKAQSGKHHEAFQHGGMVMPYEDWIGYMPWEGGTTGYFVGLPIEGPKHRTLILELYGVRAGRADTILVNDIIHFERKGDDIEFIPLPWKYPTDMRMRCANVADPLVTMLSILHDASNAVEQRNPPLKLNKARARSGKPPIPPYVTVIRPHAKRREHQGGTHASPEAHWRRAHERHLSNGEVVHVRETRVNWRDGEEIKRMFYRAK